MNWLESYEVRKLLQEIVSHPVESLSALGLLVFASLTLAQRNAIDKRDGRKSQMRHYSEEEGWHTSPERPGDKIQRHHIKPQAAGGEDEPNNIISVWEREHVGKNARPGEFVIHSDAKDALQNYRKGDKDAFKKMGKTHREKAARGEVFWNDDHDIEMSQTAIQRTQEASVRGWKWPKHTRRVK